MDRERAQNEWEEREWITTNAEREIAGNFTGGNGDRRGGMGRGETADGSGTEFEP